MAWVEVLSGSHRSHDGRANGSGLWNWARIEPWNWVMGKMMGLCDGMDNR